MIEEGGRRTILTREELFLSLSWPFSWKRIVLQWSWCPQHRSWSLSVPRLPSRSSSPLWRFCRGNLLVREIKILIPVLLLLFIIRRGPCSDCHLISYRNFFPVEKRLVRYLLLLNLSSGSGSNPDKLYRYILIKMSYLPNFFWNLLGRSNRR